MFQFLSIVNGSERNFVFAFLLLNGNIINWTLLLVLLSFLAIWDGCRILS